MMVLARFPRAEFPQPSFFPRCVKTLCRDINLLRFFVGIYCQIWSLECSWLYL